MNIGLVIHDLSKKRVFCKFAKNFDPLKCIDPEVDIKSLKEILEVVQGGVEGEDKIEGFLEEINASVGGMLAFSPVFMGYYDELEQDVRHLFKQFVRLSDVEKVRQKAAGKDKQAAFLTRVHNDFVVSGNQRLARLTSREVDKKLAISFDLVEIQNEIPRLVVQPVSLHIGKNWQKLDMAKRLAYNASKARASFGYDTAKMIAVVQEPSDVDYDVLETSVSALQDAFEVVKYDPKKNYVRRLIDSLPD